MNIILSHYFMSWLFSFICIETVWFHLSPYTIFLNNGQDSHGVIFYRSTWLKWEFCIDHTKVNLSQIDDFQQVNSSISELKVIYKHLFVVSWCRAYIISLPKHVMMSDFDLNIILIYSLFSKKSSISVQSCRIQNYFSKNWI